MKIGPSSTHATVDRFWTLEKYMKADGNGEIFQEAAMSIIPCWRREVSAQVIALQAHSRGFRGPFPVSRDVRLQMLSPLNLDSRPHRTRMVGLPSTVGAFEERSHKAWSRSRLCVTILTASNSTRWKPIVCMNSLTNGTITLPSVGHSKGDTV